ncbi:alpha/beta hydrolase [Nitriliruptoria bacterium AS10]|nr:alpha/beta hydrolase [Salsipaludibacter albus]MBY5162368.1 alpha/beta hydrolase [Salsipaludibacter albus]
MVDANGVRTFVREEGGGEPVLCLHGVPTSSFLYRKVLPDLADRGLRGISYDLPGLGLTARDSGVGPTWSDLGRHAVDVVHALGLERFHLVVHDVGGPVGMEVAAHLPDRVASLTVLNTMVAVSTFVKPWTMRPFEAPGLGWLWLKGMVDPAFVRSMYDVGIADRSATSRAEVLAHRRLLLHEDGGRAFLGIMRNFETTPAKEALYRDVVGSDRYPVQAVWGELDPALRVDEHARPVVEIVGEANFHRVPGKHFLQEDCHEAVADHVASIASRTA